MRLTIVATLYRSTAYVEEFCARAARAAQRCCEDFEIVLVSDGSPDDSVAKALAMADPRVVVVELSRNFGHHRAMMCGLAHARGDLVFLIDVDLEEAPENLEAFWGHMHGNPGVDVVEGRLSRKPGGLLRRFASRAFYALFNSLSPVKIPDSGTVSRLMSRDYVKALLQYKEADPFLPAIWIDAGFVQESIPIQKSFDGHSTYTLTRRVRMALHAIASFSSTPLTYLFYVGTALAASAVAFTVYLVLQRLFSPDTMLPGWSSVIAAVFFIGGVTIFSLGLLGAYVARIYEDVKARPNTIVRRVYRREGGKH